MSQEAARDAFIHRVSSLHPDLSAEHLAVLVRVNDKLYYSDAVIQALTQAIFACVDAETAARIHHRRQTLLDEWGVHIPR